VLALSAQHLVGIEPSLKTDAVRGVAPSLRGAWGCVIDGLDRGEMHPERAPPHDPLHHALRDLPGRNGFQRGLPGDTGESESGGMEGEGPIVATERGNDGRRERGGRRRYSPLIHAAGNLASFL
jgi:hypothetical protein